MMLMANRRTWLHEKDVTRISQRKQVSKSVLIMLVGLFRVVVPHCFFFYHPGEVGETGEVKEGLRSSPCSDPEVASGGVSAPEAEESSPGRGS